LEHQCISGHFLGTPGSYYIHLMNQSKADPEWRVTVELFRNPACAVSESRNEDFVLLATTVLNQILKITYIICV
jgi:hypothetical protein